MEEAIGKYWHRFITHHAENGYPEAQVSLGDVNKRIAIVFRALGGDGGLKIDTATPREHGAQRRWLQRVAGSHAKASLAWRDEQSLRLPEQVSLYPTKALNTDLYFWLAALAAVDEPKASNWFLANQQRTLSVLQQYPGMNKRYQRLIIAEINRRIPPAQLAKAGAKQEETIQAALRRPGSVTELPEAKRAPQPVYLWLYPDLNANAAKGAYAPADNDENIEPEGEAKDVEQKHRYQAKQEEMPNGDDGLITMRWETILSWAEYVKVNRATDDDEDDDAAGKAADMDVLSIAQDQKTSASRLRLDLDLPSAEYDDTPLSGATTLPEWDWCKGEMQPNHCVIHPMLPRDAVAKPLPEALQRTARRLRAQFSALAQNRTWLRNQNDGSELDISAYIDYHTNRQEGGAAEGSGLYKALRHSQRDIATLMLADLSMSTDAAVNNEQRVIDVIRDSLLLFSEALSACGDRYALYGFSSKKREHVRFYHLKQFDERYSDDIRGRIQALRPGYYTRMGAAIRQSTEILSKQAASKRLMLILTDGKPNDLDKYEGRYGVEDTRKAILEAKQQGLIPFCITIDKQADDYLPYLFGSTGYVVIRKPEELPHKLLGLYANLTANGG